ncbi:MAG: class I SAM-dependent methyltransferase, partial [Chloroflexi bacterium]|nr:class I SAM-dependent methyltransferase [Chloroflexota bacterium]
MAEEQNVIQWVYASKNEQELAERYDQWAKTYEDDLERDFSWYGPIRAVESAVKYVSK